LAEEDEKVARQNCPERIKLPACDYGIIGSRFTAVTNLRDLFFEFEM
jgi:hypothetical protein